VIIYSQMSKQEIIDRIKSVTYERSVSSEVMDHNMPPNMLYYGNVFEDKAIIQRVNRTSKRGEYPAFIIKVKENSHGSKLSLWLLPNVMVSIVIIISVLAIFFAKGIIPIIVITTIDIFVLVGIINEYFTVKDELRTILDDPKE